MKTTPPEFGFERLLAALERDLLEASDREILAVAKELGHKPDTKASAALSGVLYVPRLSGSFQAAMERRKNTRERNPVSRLRRRSKGDVPPSD